MKRAAIAIVVLSGLTPALLALAQSGSSGNYQGHDMGTSPATVEASSPGYVLNGSVEAIVGEGMTSPAYQVGVGAPTPSATAPVIPPVTPPSGGGGGGGGYVPPTSTTGTSAVKMPTVNHRIWTYLTTGNLNGNRGEVNATVTVNGSEVGISYPNATTWQKSGHPLGLGNNILYVQGKSGSLLSNAAQSVFRRRLVGDYNDSQYVDDIDLSLFSRAWGKTVPEADFNEDGKVDDLDLSLLASHWHQSF